jgi:REP element-mobilizing transposase RayT
VKVAPTTVGRIVGAYKSLVFKKCLEISKLKNCILGRFWQRNYYEHIIRNEAEYAKIAEYIQNNPILWRNDCFNSSISHL